MTTLHTLTDLHELLDTVQSGDIITAETLTHGSTVRTVTTGPALAPGGHVSVGATVLRGFEGEVYDRIIAVSATTREEVTVTREDEPAMRALLDGLTDGELITVVYRDGDKLTICTGPADVSTDSVTMRHAVGVAMVRWDDGEGSAHSSLHSVTVTREVTKRWEREARHTEK